MLCLFIPSCPNETGPNALIQGGHADDICSAHPHTTPPHPPSPLLAPLATTSASPATPPRRWRKPFCLCSQASQAERVARKAPSRRDAKGREASYQDNGVSAPASPLLVLGGVSFEKLQSREPPRKSPWTTALILRVSPAPSEGCACRKANRNSLRVLFTFPQLLLCTECTHWQLRDEVTLVAPAPFLTRLPTASWGPFLLLWLPFLFFPPGGSPCLLHPAFNPSSPAFSSVTPPSSRTPAAWPDSGTKKTSPRAYTSVQLVSGRLERPANGKRGGW